MTLRAVIAGSTGLIGHNQALNIDNGDVFRWRWLGAVAGEVMAAAVRGGDPRIVRPVPRSGSRRLAWPDGAGRVRAAGVRP